jgi:hypothetical protein
MSRFRHLTSRKDCIVFVLLKKQAIMNESKRFVCELLFFENMTIISFFARSNLSFLHDLMRFQRRFTVAMNVKTNCLRKYVDNVDNVFCVLSRNVKCDLKNAIQICFLQKLFKMIHSRDHTWSSYRQFFWFVKSHLWRVTHAHSRLSSDVCLRLEMSQIKIDSNESVSCFGLKPTRTESQEPESFNFGSGRFQPTSDSVETSKKDTKIVLKMRS